MINPSTTKTEHRALNALEAIIDEHDTMDYQFFGNDKEMSWDGSIWIFEENNGEESKHNFDGRLSVQIKGHNDLNNRYVNKKSISYRVALDDLRAYGTEKGVLYFQIFLGKHRTEVFYASLFPSKIAAYIEKAERKKRKESINIPFVKLAKNADTLYYIVKQFDNESKQQGTMFTPLVQNRIRVDEFEKIRSIHFSVVGVTSPYSVIERFVAGDVWAIILVMLGSVFAQAEALTLAAELDANEQFERYSSYEIDETTGNWSVHGLLSQQLISTAGQNDISGLMSDGACIIYPGIRGNRGLSLMEPVLYVVLLRNGALKAEALSISTGGVRYDFVCKPTEINLNDRHDRQGERFVLPIDEEVMALLRSLGTQGGEVRINGEKQVFRTSIVKSAEAKNARQRLEAMALPAISEFLTIWPTSYSLWDLNSAYWDSERPEMTAVALNPNDYQADWPALEKGTSFLDTKNSAAVKAYQQLLKDNAFFTATPDSNYGKVTMSSTRQAQQYYGLTATGMADRALIECLKDVRMRTPLLCHPWIPSPSRMMSMARF